LSFFVLTSEFSTTADERRWTQIISCVILTLGSVQFPHVGQENHGISLGFGDVFLMVSGVLKSMDNEPLISPLATDSAGANCFSAVFFVYPVGGASDDFDDHQFQPHRRNVRNQLDGGDKFFHERFLRRSAINNAGAPRLPGTATGLSRACLDFKSLSIHGLRGCEAISVALRRDPSH
jgi:hypothetical protein